MGHEREKGRIQELEEVTKRLNRFEDEKPGLQLEDALSIVAEKLPSEEFPLDKVFDLLVASVDELDLSDAVNLNRDLLSVSLHCAIAITERAGDLPTGLFLWGKYMNNAMRYNLLALEKGELSPSDYLSVLKASKKLAKDNGWSDFEALRRFYDHFYLGGYVYYPEESVIYPKPIGSSDLGLYQLVNKHFLLSFPRVFSLEELHNLLLDEVEELREEIAASERDGFKVAFEATDIFIYLTHIASKLDLSISTLIDG